MTIDILLNLFLFSLAWCRILFDLVQLYTKPRNLKKKIFLTHTQKLRNVLAYIYIIYAFIYIFVITFYVLVNNISIYLCDKNQFGALFIFSWPANRHSTKNHNTYQLLYIYIYIYIFIYMYIYVHIYSIPPDDGLQICPKHVEVTNEINWG